VSSLINVWLLLRQPHEELFSITCSALCSYSALSTIDQTRRIVLESSKTFRSIVGVTLILSDFVWESPLISRRLPSQLRLHADSTYSIKAVGHEARLFSFS